jgi:hypothetical protein
MHEWQGLSHVRWECKLCSAAHNLHYVPTVIMASAQRELPESLCTLANYST